MTTTSQAQPQLHHIYISRGHDYWGKQLPKLPASVFRRNLIVSGANLAAWKGRTSADF